jgi:hypothetical protein
MKKLAVLIAGTVLLFNDQQRGLTLDPGPSLHAPDVPDSYHVESESVSISSNGPAATVMRSTTMPVGASLDSSDFAARLYRRHVQSFEMGTPACLTSSSA